MQVSSDAPALDVSPTPQPLTLYERLRLVPPARIIAAVEESPDVLTLGDLKQFAKYLATEEFEHNAQAAARHAAGWYAAQIEHCTPAQGETVRTMTVEICEEVTLYREYSRSLLTEDPLPLMAGMTRRAEALDAYGAAMLIVLLLLIVPLLWSGDDVQTSSPQPAAHSTRTAGTR